MKPLPKILSLTRRDLLMWAGGEEHSLHTVVNKLKSRKGTWIICSCGESFEVPGSDEVVNALKNVPAVAT